MNPLDLISGFFSTVIGGIGQLRQLNQQEQGPSEAEKLQQLIAEAQAEAEKQKEEDQKKMFMFIGLAVIAVVVIILIVLMRKK